MHKESTGADITPMPFAGRCTAYGWKKVIDENPHGCMQLVFMEVLAKSRKSVRSETDKDKERTVHLSMSRVELIVHALKKFLQLGDGDNAEKHYQRIRDAFMNVLENGISEEWIEVFEILANKEYCDLPDLREEMLDKFGDKIIEGFLFHELVKLLSLLHSKKSNIPEKIYEEKAGKVIERLQAIGDIEDLSYTISLKLKGIDW